MSHHLLLFLSSDRLHAQLMDGGSIAAQYEFPDSPDGHDAFSVLLQSVSFPAYLLVDLIEEDFRQETVPHLIGGKRTALLQRKFEQFYRATPFRQATLLQRQKGGRRDDDMLFSALTNPALILPWLDIVMARRTPLMGIYSVPQISAPLVKDHPSDHLLLISWEKYSGLRQTYFSDHRLQISRLTPITADLTFQQAVVAELGRTYQYLKSLSLLPSGQTLDVRLLGHSRDLTELQLELPRDADMRYEFVDLADIAGQLSIDYDFTDSDASQVFLHQLLAEPPKANYANTEHTRYNTLWQLRNVLSWASAALLLGSLLFAAADIWQSRENADEAASLKIQTQRIREEARQITLTFPATHTPASEMKTAVSVMHKLDEHGHMPGDVLRPVSSMMDRYPQIELDELSWRMDVAEPGTNNTRIDVPARTITLNGRLTGFSNNYRAALDYLENFRRDLSAQGYQVAVLRRPLDVSPGGNIADQREPGAEALGFSLKLSWRPPA
ncbi:hypothetical protein FGKAn22_18910 [Ferrigenium kumadai]|uniref:Uncharacterized protein n=1 Tax=Ferrigenium kumadai TaxID=1682490 RepID=A0AAN1T005_9PROT|nr:hypothetical protein [Ferrigenium kumadai]BBJ00199.1 hypothetical protein FGKAn22_18910 [Ferrigenium kumadai]